MAADQFLTTEQVAAKLGVKRRNVQRWLQKQDNNPDKPPVLPGAFRAGRDWLIPVGSLEGFKQPKVGRPPKKEENGETWHSHRDGDGAWCRGR